MVFPSFRPSGLKCRSPVLSAATSVLVFAGLLSGAAQAVQVPANLGNSLDKLVASNIAVKALPANAAFHDAQGRGFSTEQAQTMAALAIVDVNNPNTYLVRVNLDGKKSMSTLVNNLQSSIASINVVAKDEKYRKVGVFDAFVSIDDVPALAMSAGVRSVILELKPYLRTKHIAPDDNTKNAPITSGGATNGEVVTRLGTIFDQGVTQHRIDQINKYYNSAATLDYEGTGMSIGFMSDSFNNNAGAPTAVTRFDLPGSTSNPVNTNPVVVLQDYTSGGTDEGQAMVQIGYKMAPKATLAFATGDFGEVGFANNIRALAGIPANIYPGQTFAADAICDDLGYFDEPFFQDGIIAQGVNDAAAAGVAYFSSAGNDLDINGYESDLRWVANGTGLTAAAGNTALTGTNIDLTNVPVALYAGGFHNFNPVIGQQDVAQTVNIASNANEPATVMQWDDPYDQNTSATLITPPLYTDSGTISNTTTTVTFTVPVALNTTTLYQLDADAQPGSGIDVQVTVLDPSGNTVVFQDNGVDESVRFYAPVAGAGYKIMIGRYSTTVGAFNITLSATSGYTGTTISTNISLLAFTTGGVYVPGSSLTTNTLATNEPIQLGTTLRATGSGSQLQYVIVRSNIPTGQGPTRIRYSLPGDGLSGLGPAEYFSYNATTSGGHPTASGANGMAAYSVLRPSLPEPYTSPGPARIYFDINSNRLPIPEIRQQPTLAAADGAANAVIGFNPFSGTSAAGPHAAAIAALVLQAHGGRHSMTPAQMTNLLERSTYPHDLDPSHASGVARTTTGGTVAIDINSDNQSNTGTGSKDKNAFNVTYTGGAVGSSLTSLVFNPGGTAATAGNVSDGVNAFGTFAGTPAVATYAQTSTPGLVFSNASGSYAVSTASTVPAANAVATFTNVGGSASQLFTMTLTFTGGTFTAGNVLRYTVNRLELKGSSGTAQADYWADLFGGGVLIPDGTVVNNGMSYSGTTSDGGTFSGTIKNHIGAGFSPLDGYGFINAQTAVSQTVQ